MIARLRTRHLRIFLALGVIVPIVFASGLISRPDPIPPSQLPSGLVDEESAVAESWTEYEVGSWSLPALQLQRRRGVEGRWRVRLVPGTPFAAPEALLYWLSEESDSTGAPADSAQLLGSFGGHRPRSYLLPAESEGGGWLVLYSLGHGREIARASLEEMTRPEAR